MRSKVDFLIVGAARSGTKYLYERSKEHPRAGMCTRKEMHFFDYEYARGLRWYLSHFPAAGIAGEASVDYMFHPLAAYRIARTFPNVKIVVVLRNPIDRAYSHWALFRRERKEALRSFRAAINVEGKRTSSHFRRYSYLSRGLYADQLYRLHSLFPHENVMVLRSETLFDRPAETLNRFWSFVGLGPHVLPPRSLVKNAHKGIYNPMDAKTRQFLAEFFREPNARLEAMLGRRMDWK